MKPEEKIRRCGQIVVSLLAVLIFGVGSVLAADFNWRKYEGTTIRVLSGKSAFTRLTKKHIREFEAATGIKVQHEAYPSMPLRKKVLMELGARNKDLDVFQGMMKMAFQYEKAGWLEPLDQYIHNKTLTNPDFDFEDFFPRTRAIINGKLIGLSNSVNPQVLIYRKDLFRKYNVKVPTNWKELEKAAKKLTLDTNGDGKTDIYGWIARMNNENTAPFANFLYNNGATYLDENRKPVFNSPQAVEAFKFYGYLARKYGPPGAAAIGWKEVVGAIAQGKAAMTVEISIFAKLVLENPKRSRVVGKLGYARFPAAKGGTPKAMLPCNIQFISSFSRKKEAAWLYLQFMASKERMLEFQILGLPMTRRSCWENPRFKASDKLPGLSRIQLEAIKNGIIGFEIPIAGFAEARPVISRVIYTAYEGGDVQKAADDAVKQVEDIMRRTQ